MVPFDIQEAISCFFLFQRNYAYLKTFPRSELIPVLAVSLQVT